MNANSIVLNYIKFQLAIFLFIPAKEIKSQPKKSPAPANQKAAENIDLSASSDPNKAFKYKNYRSALEGFKLLETKEPNSAEVAYKIGQCYLLGSLDYSKAIEYFLKASKMEKVETDVLFQLGNAYHKNLELDNAISTFEKYIAELNKLGAKEDELKKAKRAIEYCQNTKYFLERPEDVTFENLGKEINTQYSELDPFITPNKTFMVFSSNRSDGNQCTTPRKSGYTTDLYFSVYKTGKWSRALNMGVSVNTPLNERVCGINDEGNAIFLYIDNEESSKDGDIYLSLAKNKVFDTPFSLKGLVNSKDEESAASLSADGSTLFFSSDRDGGDGMKDIYVAKKLPDQTWGEPKRIKKNINTPYNEDFPMVTDNDKKLYFCSEGHNSIGGYDIFISTWVDSLNEWSIPVNLGYPINTPEDNYSISFTDKMHEGYMSAIRKEGFGDYDIYKILFNQSETAPYTILRGQIKNGDEVMKGNVKMTMTSKRTGKVYGIYNMSEKKNGNFCLILAPGEYSVSIEQEDAQPFLENLIVLDNNKRGEVFNKNFTLKKKGELPETKEQKDTQEKGKSPAKDSKEKKKKN